MGSERSNLPGVKGSVLRQARLNLSDNLVDVFRKILCDLLRSAGLASKLPLGTFAMRRPFHRPLLDLHLDRFDVYVTPIEAADVEHETIVVSAQALGFRFRDIVEGHIDL